MLIQELFEAKKSKKVTKKAKISKEQRAVVPNAVSLPHVGQQYPMYRFGMLMASVPETPDGPINGAIGDVPLCVPYTSAEAEIIDSARKLGGFGPIRNLTGGPSREPDDTHRASPVSHNSGKHKK